jgi:uncharacterized protein (TIGR02001 family)
MFIHAARRVNLLLAALLLFGVPAFGDELSGNVALTTDYRFRGVSLSNRLPAAQAGVDFDHSTGLFAGAFASTVRTGSPDTHLIAQLYGGYAREVGEGLSAEVGAVRYVYWHDLEHGEGDYTEGFAGLSSARGGVRLYGTNSYFGSGAPAAYLEGSASRELSTHVHATLHVGVLATGDASHRYSEYSDARRIDGRAGIAFDYAGVQLEISVVALAASKGDCARGTHRCSPGVVLSLRHGF